MNECGRRGPLIDRRPADKAATKPLALGGRRAAGDKWPTAAEDEEAQRLMFRLSRQTRLRRALWALRTPHDRDLSRAESPQQMIEFGAQRSLVAISSFT